LLNTVLGGFSSGVAASTSSYESIQSVTVGAGGASSISFTSIPATYASLQIRYLAQNDAAYEDFFDVYFAVNTSTSYAYHNIWGSGSAVSAGGQSSRTTSFLGTYIPSGNASRFGVAIIDIHNYASTTQNKTVRAFGGYDKNGSGYITLGSVLSINTAAIDTITLSPSSTKFSQYSTFALYGIKGA